MKSTLLHERIQRYVTTLYEHYPLLQRMVTAIQKEGAQVLLVGGAVRDVVMGVANKDIDIEVHGITLDALQKIMATFGPVNLVGKSFGVLRVHGLDVDWSVPRKDSAGRKPQVMIDPSMSVEEAFRRRDVTMNAMGIDLATNELIDPFSGQSDIDAKRLRATDTKLFAEDPLRFYRVMQFISRFECHPDDALNAVCKSMDLSQISRERIESEFEKMLLKSERPSLGLRWIRDIGKMQELFPELAATIGVEQEKEYHPEVEVFEHLMQSLDAAAQIAKDFTTMEEKRVLLYAALCHDLGKPETRKIIDGRMRFLGHDKAGVAKARSFLKRITHNQELIDTVAVLVEQHMQPGQFEANNAGPAAYKRLAKKLAPHTTMRMLAALALADKRGRSASGHEPLSIDVPSIKEFIEKSEAAQVFIKPEEPVLQGRDLMDIVQPGPKMGELLARAYEIQIEEGIRDKEVLKKRIFNV